MLGIIVGIIIGFVASKLYDGEGKGCWINLILGLVGGWVGGKLFGWLGITVTGAVGSFAMAVIGAIVVLWIWNKIF